MIAFQALVAISMVVFGAILGHFNLVGLGVVPIIIGIVIAYMYLLATLKTLFGSVSKDGNRVTSMNESDSKNSKIINEFKITARFIVTGCVISIISIVIYGILTVVHNWKESGRENEVSVLIISMLFYRTGFIICNFGLARYIHRRVVVMLEKSSVIDVAHDHSTEQPKSFLSSKESHGVIPGAPPNQ